VSDRADAIRARLADATPGFTGADLAALARGAALEAAEEGEEGADAVAARHFASALAGATPSPPVPADLQAAYASFERAGFGG
jgi:SpoVK/Ycf46/Vps4 family AAA+-type ATPase